MSYFQDWLELEGTSTFTSFRKFSKVTKNSKTYHYYCCQFTTQGYSDFEKKTSRKNEKGTVSKSVCCPVRIWACEEMNKISVFYFPKHNHEQKFENCKYQPLKQSTRCLIKANLRLSVPPQKIRDILQDGSGNRENRNNFPVKESFVSRKTISAYSRYLNNSLRPSSDAVSVNSIIETLKCEAYNPVLLYKPQNNSTLYGPTDLDNLPNHKVSFALGLQTREQKEMMIKGCTEILCIESTHKTNQYDFYLLNLIVPDEFGCGYPVAHFITNFLDADTLYCLFNSLKCRVPNLYVNCVMTDDDKVTYPAFSKVFGQDVKHLLCSCHIRQSWFRQLNSKVVDKEVRQKMLGELTKILHERNQITFHDQISKFLNDYSRKSRDFIEYFSENYKNRLEEWALCYRNFPHAFTDTNMYCESFHNQLKTVYFKRRHNRRLDILISTLLTIEKDKYLNHTYKLYTNVSPRNSISCLSRHQRGLKIRDSDVNKCSDTSWTVCSPDKK
ncbi:uncharacterized protein LOC118189203 [Stegodyphus dumicola]|uniref:uncharacterized protein LOC118189203 n=1 Tax=Stegodyphus dumicola TaxID=202533 RepID=UPI0015B08EC5|nr:uncharacterized protein LOC118189203 [Stegodyphus dumicola]